MKKDFIDNLAEYPFKIIPAAVATVISCGICIWLIAFALDAQASKLDEKLEQQKFYNIKSTFNK